MDDLPTIERTDVGTPEHVAEVLENAKNKFDDLPDHLRKPIKSFSPDERREYNAIMRERRKQRDGVKRQMRETATEPQQPAQTLFDVPATEKFLSLLSGFIAGTLGQKWGLDDEELKTFPVAFQPFVNRLANTIGASSETSLAAMCLMSYFAKRLTTNVFGNLRDQSERENDFRKEYSGAAFPANGNS